MNNAIDYNALGWMRQELGKVLKQACSFLEEYAGNRDNTACLQDCAKDLHQARGPLQMVGLKGADRLAVEMEEVIADLLHGTLEQPEAILEVLMQAFLQLPDYLSRIHAGSSDNPVALLPVINSLREVRGVPALEMSALFTPDLALSVPSRVFTAHTLVPDSEIQARARVARPQFQSSLLEWYRGDEGNTGLQAMHTVLRQMLQDAGRESVARLWWVAAAMTSAMIEGDMVEKTGTKQLYGQLDRQIKRLIDAGESVFDDPLTDALMKNLLYQITTIESSMECIQLIKTTYNLDQLLGGIRDSAGGDESLAGCSDELLQTVSVTASEDIERVKDRLDVFARGTRSDPGSLLPIADELHALGNMLDMLGIDRFETAIAEKAQLICDMATGAADIEDTALMAVANLLVAVEDAVHNLGGSDSLSQNSGANGQFLNEGMEAVVREAVNDMARAKEAIVEFIKSPDDFETLAEVPGLLSRVRGSLQLSGKERAAVATGQIEQFIAGELVEQHNQLSDSQYELLADAVCSVEYYIEESGEDDVRGDRVLGMAEESLATLSHACPLHSPEEVHTVNDQDESPEQQHSSGNSMVADVPLDKPDDSPEEECTVNDQDESPEQQDSFENSMVAEASLDKPADSPEEERTVNDQDELPEQQDSFENSMVAEASLDKPADSPEVPVITDLQMIDADVDEEILAIFIEEADEVLVLVGEQLPAWFAAVDDTAPMIEVRRGFHTIKGSGRMVGALALGEFAWTFEDLLNRVIDGAIEPGDELRGLLGQSVAAMTQLLAQIKNTDAALEVDVNAMVRKAVMLSQPGAQFVDPSGDQVESSGDEQISGKENQVTEGTPEQDPELLDIFIKECSEHLLIIKEFLESNQAPCTVTESLYRSLHTISGISGSVNVSSISKLAAVLEEYFDGLYQEHCLAGVDALDVLRDSAAEMNRMVEQLPDMSINEEFQQQLCARAGALPKIGEAQPVDDPFSSVDSEILDIFIEEASEIIDAGENTLRAWSEEPDNHELMAEYQRHLHTLKGGARMVDITPIGDLSHTLESLLTRVGDGHTEATAELFVLLQDSHDHLAEMLEHVKAHEFPADAGELQTVIDGMGLETVVASDAEPLDTPVEHDAVSPDVDDEGHGSGSEPEPDIEVEPETEAVAEADIEVEPEPETEAVAEAGIEVEPEPETEAVVEADIEAGPGPEVQTESGEPAEAGKASDAEADMEQQEILPDLAKMQKMDALPQRVERRRSPRIRSEQVRVRADLLDNMVNHAGEISIYRTRMEQQISDYRYNLAELDQTIGRLREQLRQVEIETETHILFRYEQDGKTVDHDFDPLEMDRYSNLQELSRSLIESISDLRSIQELMSSTTRESETLLLQQSRVSTDLQESMLHSRMIPFSGLAPRLRRVLRQSAKQLGKKVDLRLEGADGEMDRTVIDRIIAPLEHMLRNAVAHGIEKPAIREQAGKSPVGSVAIGFQREGSEIVLRIEDDGAGLDIEAIRARAVESNLLDADAKLPDSDIMQFVLQTGFSTAVEVTQISGRGVGMDVVNGEVKQLGGVLHISSTPGMGTVFTVRLPYTVAINQALLVRAGEETFCIPLGGIDGIARFFPEELADCYQSENSMLEYAGADYQLKHLGSLLGLKSVEQGMQQGRVPVLLVRLGEKRIAFQLESILGSREIVIKPLGAQLNHVDGLSGATILGDGRVVLILDIMSLSRMQGRLAVPDMTAASRGDDRLHVMVVDDSITVRKVTTRLLERNGFRVLTAKDGVDALGQLQDNVPDMMLLDIEMPRMDGFELATHMRNDDRLKHVPIIMITSRTGDKHRKHASQIGVNDYLGKPYQESELLESINNLIDVRKSEVCA